MSTSTKAIILAKAPEELRVAIESGIRSEIEWCDNEGPRCDVAYPADFVSRAEFDFVYAHPPLDELRLESIWWPKNRFAIHWMNGKTLQPTQDAVYLQIGRPSAPQMDELLG